jgi:hypothetical protein
VSIQPHPDAGESGPLAQPGWRNLTVLAREGKLDPLIGRGAVVERVMGVLSRRTKNIPVLVGEPGVGKTAIVEGLARRIVIGEVPETIRDKQLYELDPRAVLSISTQRSQEGTAGNRLEAVLAEITAQPDVILFIDDLPAIVDPGTSNAALAGAASILKPMLAGGELLAICATTPDGYRRHLEKDAALDRRLQPIPVAEPTVSHTIELLKGMRDRYEGHHRVSITDDALVAAAQLADRYIHDRFLPGKAADLLDEAGSRTRVSRLNAPPDLREYDQKIAEVRREKESAIYAQDFEKAAAFRDTEKQLIARKDTREKEWKAGDRDAVAEVNAELIAEIVAELTHLPVSELIGSTPAAAVVSDAVTVFEPISELACILLNDQPVNDADSDLLGTDAIAAGIGSMLTASRAASPFVMAIDGRWGMGKSTLLRQIESQLSAAPDVAVVRFNAWTAEGTNALEGLIKSVLVQLDPVVIRRRAKMLARQRNVMFVAQLLSAIVGRFLGVTRLVDELWRRLGVDAQSRNQLRDVIHGMLSEWSMQPGKQGTGRALVVFIDDLDRCSDDVVTQVCDAVKLYLDAPGLIFVIACDLSVLARGVSAAARGEANEGRAYLEKIVQVAYRLPPPQEGQVRRLINGYVQQSRTAGLIDDQVKLILAERAGRNPRRIKRIINSFVVEYQLNPAWRRAPLGVAQLARVIVLQHLYAPFYDLLVSDVLGSDPIGEFLDYAAVRAMAGDPPAADHAWWSTASRSFQRRGLPPPERSPGTGSQFIPQLEQLERELPSGFPALARDSAFVTLLDGFGDAKARYEVREQLISRPLGTDAALTDGEDDAP